jgi:hypothetical protein
LSPEASQVHQFKTTRTFGPDRALERAGYPLELHVTSVLRAAGFGCEKSPYFLDHESGKPREIDILGWKYCKNEIGYHVHLHLVIECKKSTSPFVVLCHDAGEDSLLRHSLFNNLSLSSVDQIICGSAIFAKKDSPELFSRRPTPLLDAPTRCGYAVVQAHQNGDTAVYNEVHKLAKAFEHQVKGDYKFKKRFLRGKEKADKRSRKEMEKTFLCHWPVLVVDAPLVEAYLEQDGQLVVAQREFSTIQLRLPWQKSFHDGLAIPVITKPRFAEFVNDILDFSGMIVDPDVMESGLHVVRLGKKEKRKTARLSKIELSSTEDANGAPNTPK